MYKCPHSYKISPKSSTILNFFPQFFIKNNPQKLFGLFGQVQASNFVTKLVWLDNLEKGLVAARFFGVAVGTIEESPPFIVTFYCVYTF